MTTENRLDSAASGLGRSTALGFRRTVALGVAGTAIVALAGLLGYVPGLRGLGSIRPDYIPMAPSTAVCFLILSAALFRHARKPWQGSGLTAMAALVLLATLFCLLDVAGSFAGMDLNFEDHLLPEMGTLGEIPVGRMSPATGAIFTVAGLGTFLHLLRSRSSRWASSLGFLTTLAAATVLIAYLYGTPVMYSGATIPVAATTAMAFFFLGVAVIASGGPESFPMRHVTGDSTSARLSRAFLPLTVTVVFLQSILSQFVSAFFAFNEALLAAVLVIVVGTITAFVIARVARLIGNSLDEADRNLRQARDLLRESEARVQKKLQSILSPVDDIGPLELADIMDVGRIQDLMDRFYRFTRVPSAIIDLKGKVFVGTGWQDICTKFHRLHPETLSNCIECDTVLSKGVLPGTFKAYLCTNGLWDCVTPLMVGGRHVGNLFIGQFFFEGEKPDDSVFRAQAAKYGFDVEEYMAALRRVPVWNRETISVAFEFCLALANMIASLSHGNIVLARMLEERKRVEAEIESARDYIANIVDTIGDPLFVKDDQHRFVVANAAFSALTGYPLGEVIGKTDTDFFPQKQVGLFWEKDDHVLTTGLENVNEESVTDARTGETRTVVTRKTRYVDPNGSRFIVGISRDITERKRAEAEREKLQAQLNQAQKMESVGRLAGGVAHDFNNMLGVILGHTEMALEQVDPAEPIHADLTEIGKAAERSADLTRQLLAFARKQTIAPRVLDLNEAVAGMLKMLQRLIGENINLLWLPGADLGPVKLDPSQIDQIMANLCVNARDAITDVGKITIETGNSTFDAEYCATHAGFVPGEYVRLVVSDDGCGMDKETLSHLFEPFFTTKGIGKGTGLGLVTVYGAVKQNNGFINAYSEPGQGTTFTIYLPRHVGKAEQLRTKGPVAAAGHSDATVLLVEDEPSILNICGTMLEKLGYKVLAASTPGEAIRLAETHLGEIHLLMTDVVMPEMNGRDLAKNLLSLYPQLKRLFMSGYTADVIAHHGVLDAGVYFIQKPFSINGLAAKVREALSDE